MRNMQRGPYHMQEKMNLPQLSDEQRKKALGKATQARHERALLRDQIKSGEKTLSDLLADDSDPIVAKLKVSALLESMPGFGKAKTAKIMEELGISPSRRIQGLGRRQRDELLKRFS